MKTFSNKLFPYTSEHNAQLYTIMKFWSLIAAKKKTRSKVPNLAPARTYRCGTCITYPSSSDLYAQYQFMWKMFKLVCTIALQVIDVILTLSIKCAPRCWLPFKKQQVPPSPMVSWGHNLREVKHWWRWRSPDHWVGRKSTASWNPCNRQGRRSTQPLECEKVFLQKNKLPSN